VWWIIIEADADDELYVDGKMQQCNWELIWQRKDGSFARYWCIDENATQYNSGETSMNNGKATIGSSQHMLTVPCNEDTVIVDTPQRFFLDRNMSNPTAYKVTQNDTVSYNYGKGILKITTTEDEMNPAVDKLITLETGENVWIADYFSPTPTQPDVPDDNGVIVQL